MRCNEGSVRRKCTLIGFSSLYIIQAHHGRRLAGQHAPSCVCLQTQEGSTGSCKQYG